jgi:ribosome-binding protein aMBF1 (putative translation factor)
MPKVVERMRAVKAFRAKSKRKSTLAIADYPAQYFELARLLIETRITQAQLAMRMKTTQSVVARLESGRVHPSYKTLRENRSRYRHPPQHPLRDYRECGVNSQLFRWITS